MIPIDKSNPARAGSYSTDDVSEVIMNSYTEYSYAWVSSKPSDEVSM